MAKSKGWVIMVGEIPKFQFQSAMTALNVSQACNANTTTNPPPAVSNEGVWGTAEVPQEISSQIFTSLDRSSIKNALSTSNKINEAILRYLKEETCPKIQTLMRTYFPSQQAEQEIAEATSSNDDHEYILNHFKMLDKPRDEMKNTLLHFSVMSNFHIPYDVEMTTVDHNRIITATSGPKKYSLLQDLLDVHADLKIKNDKGMNAMHIAKKILDTESQNLLKNAGSEGIWDGDPTFKIQDYLWLNKGTVSNWGNRLIKDVAKEI